MDTYADYVYPFLIKLLSNPRPMRKIRRRLIPLAAGVVLEIGVGAGANLPHYDPARVRQLLALEPNRRMVRIAERQPRPAELDVEFLILPGEAIPLQDKALDTVVSTFTLCTVASPDEVLRSVQRVLKPGGTLIFCELGLALDSEVQRWQRRWEPVHRRVFQGLRLTWDIPGLDHATRVSA